MHEELLTRHQVTRGVKGHESDTGASWPVAWGTHRAWDTERMSRDESMDGKDRQHPPDCADLAALVEGHEICTDEGHQYAGQTGLMEGDAGGRCGSHLRHDRRRETAATAGRRRQRGDRSRMVLRVARRTAISCNCRRRILDRAHRVLKNIHRSDLVDAAGVRTPLAHLHHILVGACVSLPTSPPPVGCPIDSNEAASLHLRVLRCERSETIFVCSDGGSSNRYARPTPSLLAAQRQHDAPEKKRVRSVERERNDLRAHFLA